MSNPDFVKSTTVGKTVLINLKEVVRFVEMKNGCKVFTADGKSFNIDNDIDDVEHILDDQTNVYEID